jgi:hypothetical protein
MSKFGAAIEWLREARGCIPEEGKEIEAAIRVLGAAGKVDKVWAKRIIKHPFYSIHEALDSPVHDQEKALDALIAALPDGGKE